jgi:hypothetical protein
VTSRRSFSEPFDLHDQDERFDEVGFFKNFDANVIERGLSLSTPYAYNPEDLRNVESFGGYA